MTTNKAAQQHRETYVDVVVQDRNQAYSSSHRGVRASSTNSAMAAAERLAEKLFGPGAQVAKLPRVEGDPTTITRWHLSAAPAPLATREEIERQAHALVATARAAGFHVEIGPRPLKPLAMGNIELQVTVWARKA